MEIRIFGVGKLLLLAFEINAAVANHEKARGRGVLIGLIAFYGRVADHALRFFVEAKIGESKTILQTLRGEQRGNAVDIPQAQDERDDGLGSYRIEARGWRVIKTMSVG